MLKYLIFIDFLYGSRSQRETAIHEAQYKNKQHRCFYFVCIFSRICTEYFGGIRIAAFANVRRDLLR